MFEIKLAQSQKELSAIYHFRYRIYIEEMQRIQHDADHVNKTIIDEMDEGAFHLIALKDAEMIGVARINLGKTISQYYLDFYKILIQPDAKINNTSVITRLMFANNFRGNIYVYKMFLACYEFGLWQGIKFNFIDCDNKSANLYESVGCKKYLGQVKHKEHVESNPMIIDLHDEALFKQINSPFLKPYLKWKNADLNIIRNQA